MADKVETKVIKSTFLLRRGDESEWQGKSLNKGEPGFATDSGVLKVGQEQNGQLMKWEDLPAMMTKETADNTYLPLSGGTLNGSLNLGSNSLFSTSGINITSIRQILGLKETNGITLTHSAAPNIAIKSPNVKIFTTNGTTIKGSLKLDDSPIDMNSHKITNLTDPTSTQDAATKNYIITRLKRISSSQFYKALRVPGRSFTPLVVGDEKTSIDNYTLPSGYTLYEYVESNGSQYVNSELIPNENTGFYIDYNTSSTIDGGYGCIFGQRVASGSEEYQLSTFAQTASGLYRYSTQNYAPGIVPNTRQQISLRNNILTRPENRPAGLEKTQSITGGILNTTFPISVFAVNTGGAIQQSSSTRIYRLIFYSGVLVVRDFVPAKNPDGEIGFFDLSTLPEYAG